MYLIVEYLIMVVLCKRTIVSLKSRSNTNRH